MRRLVIPAAVLTLLVAASSESEAQLIMEPAIPIGPFTTSTPFATGMVDNSIPPVVYPSARRGFRYRRGGVYRRGRAYAAPPRQQAVPRPRKSSKGK